MPKGDSPNSRKNLIQNQGLSREEVRKINSKGGINSGKARNRLKSFRELDDEYTSDEERKKMLDTLKQRAKQGNLRAFELYRDTMGMKPTDNVKVSTVDGEAVAKLQDAIAKRRDNAKQS